MPSSPGKGKRNAFADRAEGRPSGIVFSFSSITINHTTRNSGWTPAPSCARISGCDFVTLSAHTTVPPRGVFSRERSALAS